MKDFEFVFDRFQNTKIPREKILQELERIAKIYDYTEFRGSDFEKHATMSRYAVIRDFGSWKKGIQALRQKLKESGIELKDRRVKKYSEKELFDEMERIWTQLGHRPSKDDWQSSNPKISYDTYLRNFGGWRNACLRFIEFKMGKRILTDDEEVLPTKKTNSKSTTERKTRHIPARLRLKVLHRDNYRCVKCGKSPATNIGVQLHIDHIVPFAKGGENTESNLRTLCATCNLGKGDIEDF
jgi:hypothetical protein